MEQSGVIVVQRRSADDGWLCAALYGLPGLIDPPIRLYVGYRVRWRWNVREGRADIQVRDERGRFLEHRGWPDDDAAGCDRGPL